MTDLEKAHPSLRRLSETDMAERLKGGISKSDTRELRHRLARLRSQLKNRVC